MNRREALQAGAKCESCYFWERCGGAEQDIDECDDDGRDAMGHVVGKCRRNPPSIAYAAAFPPGPDDNRAGLKLCDHFDGMWPFTDCDDWCGEYESSVVDQKEICDGASEKAFKGNT